MPRRSRFAAAATLAAVTGLGVPLPAHAQGDDWNLRRRSDDPDVVRALLRRVRKDPLSTKAARAVERALGPTRAAASLQRRAAEPGADVEWTLALAELRALRDPDAGLHTLEAVEVPVRWQRAVAERKWQWLTKLRRDTDALALALSEARAAGTGIWWRRALRTAERLRRPADAKIAAAALLKLEDRAEHRIAMANAHAALSERDEADENFTAAWPLVRRSARAEVAHAWLEMHLQHRSWDRVVGLAWELAPDVPMRDRTVVWRALERAAIASASYASAVAKLDALPSTAPLRRDAWLWATRARLEAAAGQANSASWTEATRLRPADWDLATAAFRSRVLGPAAQGDPSEASSAADALARRFGHRATSALLHAAGELNLTGRREAATALTGVAKRLAKTHPERLELVAYYAEHGPRDEALQQAAALQGGVLRHPEHVERLGELLFVLGQRDAAAAQWQRLPALTRPRHAGMARAAQAHLLHHDTAGALDWIDSALRLAPNQPAYLRTRATIHDARRRPDLARVDWEALYEVAQGAEHRLYLAEARTRYIESLLHTRAGRRGHAALADRLREAQRALDRKEATPDAIEAALLLGELAQRRDQPNRAAQILRAGLALAPEEPRLLARLASALQQAGHFEHAEDTLKRLATVDPSRRATVTHRRAELELRRGEIEEALALAEDAARQRRTADPLIRLGERLRDEGRLAAAQGAFDRARVVAPSDDRATLLAADVAALRGDPDAAMTYLQAVVEGSGAPDVRGRATSRMVELAQRDGTLTQLAERTLAELPTPPPQGLALLGVLASAALAPSSRAELVKSHRVALGVAVDALLHASSPTSAQAALDVAASFPGLASPTRLWSVATRPTPATLTSASQERTLRARVQALRGLRPEDLSDAQKDELGDWVERAAAPRLVRETSAWLLAQTGDLERSEPWLSTPYQRRLPVATAYACIARARDASPADAAGVREALRSGHRFVARACAFAAARDNRADGAALRASIDPWIAALGRANASGTPPDRPRLMIRPDAIRETAEDWTLPWLSDDAERAMSRWLAERLLPAN